MREESASRCVRAEVGPAEMALRDRKGDVNVGTRCNAVCRNVAAGVFRNLESFRSPGRDGKSIKIHIQQAVSPAAWQAMEL